jgi:DNA-binding beta-propeller fold protein YncE
MQGGVYVTENAVAVFRVTGDGKFLKTWGEPGSSPGNFQNILDVFVDPEDRVWVTEASTGRVQVFDTEGQVLWALEDGPKNAYISGGPNGDVYLFAHPEEYNPESVLHRYSVCGTIPTPTETMTRGSSLATNPGATYCHNQEIHWL